jgi:hypothetical protein
MWKRIRNSAMPLTKTLCFGAALLLTSLAARGAVAPRCEPLCPVPQSPRNISPGLFNIAGSRSVVAVAPDEASLVYTYFCDREMKTVTLHKCGRHYHCPIENVQGCARDTGPLVCTVEPQPGQWIEVHTVYAATVRQGCDPQTLDCCETGPFVVRAFSATVDPQGSGPRRGPLAEWSGSDTAPDTECRTTPAQWSFELGCDFKITPTQLTGLKAKPAQKLQGGLRVSKDLTLVPAQ